MKTPLVVVVGLLGFTTFTHAGDNIDCSAKPPSEPENIYELLAYKSECEIDCKNTLPIYCEKHAHGKHDEHPVDILKEERVEQAKDKAQAAKEKREESARLRRERGEREARIEAIVRRLPKGIERR